MTSSQTEPRLIASGTKVFEDGECWCDWWLFAGSITLSWAIYSLDLVVHYSGPGETFACRPGCRRSRSYTLITQRGGLDI